MLAINLAACSHLTPQPGGGWQLRGRIAVRTAEDAVSFTIRWSQIQDQFDIRLSTTLGILVAHIYGDDHGVTLVSDGDSYSANTAQVLLHQQIGLLLPVDDLRYWVRGKPAPTTSFQWLENTLCQSDWLIEYKTYKHGKPMKLKMTHARASITLAIKKWL